MILVDIIALCTSECLVPPGLETRPSLGWFVLSMIDGSANWINAAGDFISEAVLDEQDSE